MPSVHVLREGRSPVQRDYAKLAIPLIFNHHVSGALNDVHIAVVSGRKDRWSAKRKASYTESQIVWVIGLHRPLCFDVFISGWNFLHFRSGLLALGRERRNSAIGRIDNQRGSPVRLNAVLPGTQGINSGVINRGLGGIGIGKFVSVLHAGLEYFSHF